MKWESMFDGKHNAKKYHHDVKQKKKKVKKSYVMLLEAII